jgi:phage shock protein C
LTPDPRERRGFGGIGVLDAGPPRESGRGVARNRLVRPRRGKMIAGVCAGIADFFDVNVTLVRLLFVLFGLWGPGEVAYIALWIVAPKAPS